MLERDVRKGYRNGLAGAMALYAGVLIGAIHLAKPMPAGTARTLLLLAPAIPVMLGVWIVARQFWRMDEFLRQRSLESIAVAAAATAGWTMTYGFLEMAGLPRLSMFWVWPVMGFCWAAHAGLRALLGR